MSVYEAPAKLNLALHVDPPAGDGYHPVTSMVQTVEWSDLLTVSQGEGADSLEIAGADLAVEANLVTAALDAVRRRRTLRPLAILLEKRLPEAAGLGGGSSDAAAALLAARERAGLDAALIEEVAALLGSDVPLFLTGGTLRVTGRGDRIEPLRGLEGMAFAIAVPGFGLDTSEVYARWDEMEGPTGEPMPEERLPPSLRGGMPMRNDLLPAALAIEPALGDFMADLRAAWGTAVALTGSGSACFAYFGTGEEAADAASAVSAISSVAVGADPRDHGVSQK